MFMNHSLFWDDPYLLPCIAFDPLSAKDSSSSAKYFSVEEDNLLVLGMDHYGTSAWKVIQENLFPTKTARQLQLRVKNQCSKRTGDNVIKHFKKTKEVKIPFKEEDDRCAKLPQWVVRYYKKRLEKEKQIDEDQKRGEKQTDGCSTVENLIENVLKRSSVLHPKPALGHDDTTRVSVQTESGGSTKRKLFSKSNESDSESKRVCTSLSATKTKRTHYHHKRNKGFQSTARPVSVSPHASSNQIKDNVSSARNNTVRGKMEQLLFAAGFEASDADARYAYDYLMEVKTTLCRDHDDDVYQQFLDSLLRAKQEKWDSKRIFKEVNILLKPWPHLLTLFLHFLTPEECIKMSTLEDKMNLEGAESFASSLQEKFSESPMKLSDVVSKLKELDSEGVSLQSALDSLLPLIEVHEELVEDLRRFLHHLAPSPKPKDVFDEISFNNDLDKEWDDFEEISVMDSNDESNKADLGTKNELHPRNNALTSIEAERISSKQGPQVTYHCAYLDSEHDSSNAVCGQTSKEGRGSEQDTEPRVHNSQTSIQHCSGSQKWTREQDRLIIKNCLQLQNDEIALKEAIRRISASIGCDSNEVSTRFKELMKLLNNSMKSCLVTRLAE